MASPLDERKLRGGFEQRDGVWVPRARSRSAYEVAWENAAAANHVVAAIAREAPDETLEQLTAKTSPVWERLACRQLGTVLDLGCGYGRLALHLSCSLGASCETYIGIDVSETMLRHAARYCERFGAFPGARLTFIRTRASNVPLEDASVDLVISSAVLLHLGKADVRRTLAEVRRVLAPRGSFVFEASFPNRWCPANVAAAARGLVRRRTPLDVDLYSRREVGRLVEEAGVADASRYRVEAASRGILPRDLGPLRLWWARRLNERIERRCALPDVVAASSFTVTTLGSESEGTRAHRASGAANAASP